MFYDTESISTRAVVTQHENARKNATRLGGREKTRVFQIMDFSFFVKKRGFAGGGSKSQNT